VGTSPKIEIALVRWPEDCSHAEVLGRLTDPDLVELVRRRVVALQRRKLAELESPVRLVPPCKPGGA